MVHQDYKNDVHDEIQLEQEELTYSPPFSVSPSPCPVQTPGSLIEGEISTPEDDQTAEPFSDAGTLQEP